MSKDDKRKTRRKKKRLTMRRPRPRTTHRPTYGDFQIALSTEYVDGMLREWAESENPDYGVSVLQNPEGNRITAFALTQRFPDQRIIAIHLICGERGHGRALHQELLARAKVEGYDTSVLSASSRPRANTYLRPTWGYSFDDTAAYQDYHKGLPPYELTDYVPYDRQNNPDFSIGMYRPIGADVHSVRTEPVPVGHFSTPRIRQLEDRLLKRLKQGDQVNPVVIDD